MISFDKTNSGTNSNVLVSFQLYVYRIVCGTFVERLFLYCVDITCGNTAVGMNKEFYTKLEVLKSDGAIIFRNY
jgi:hypothetical protein